MWLDDNSLQPWRQSAGQHSLQGSQLGLQLRLLGCQSITGLGRRLQRRLAVRSAHERLMLVQQRYRVVKLTTSRSSSCMGISLEAIRKAEPGPPWLRSPLPTAACAAPQPQMHRCPAHTKHDDDLDDWRHGGTDDLVARVASRWWLEDGLEHLVGSRRHGVLDLQRPVVRGSQRRGLDLFHLHRSGWQSRSSS